MTINTVWADRETGEKFRVDAVTPDGRVQISPLAGGSYRIMAEKSLRSNYQLVAMTPEKAETAPAPEPETPDVKVEEKETPSQCKYMKCQWNALPPGENSQECIGCDGSPKDWKPVREEAPAPEPTEGKNGRAPAGRVQMPDGKVIAGAQFIIEVCGKKRDETYKVDSPIRWLLKPDGQALLKKHGATIVYGQPVTK